MFKTDLIPITRISSGSNSFSSSGTVFGSCSSKFSIMEHIYNNNFKVITQQRNSLWSPRENHPKLLQFSGTEVAEKD